MTSVNTDLYLSPDQQDLLLAALNSNHTSSMFLPNSLSTHRSQVDDHQFIPSSDFASMDHFTDHKSTLNGNTVPTSVGSNSDMDMTRTNSLTTFGGITALNESPIVGELDFPFDMDGSYDYDLGIPGDFETTIDSINGTPLATEHEKRKSPPTDDGSPEAHETGPKRRGKESEDKVAKKPGRKPLTSEPTSKRKAQNRAAQRAFRERKEKHLKDLEEKVADLEKASESANKENSLLRSQIERLQAELQEYRKRMNESKTNFSSILGKGSNGGFQFEFPMFGGANKPTTSSRLQAEKNNEAKRNVSSASPSGLKVGPGTLLERPRSIHSSSSNSTPNARILNGTPATMSSSRASNSPPSTQRSVSTSYTSLFTPTQGTARDATADFTRRINENKNNDRNTPGSTKHDPSSSPSASSVSHHGTNSSYMTSPESSYSPTVFKQDNLDTVSEEIQVVSSDHDEPGFYCGVLDDGETSFCEKLGAIACGNPRNPVPLSPDSKLLPNLNEVIPRPDPASVARRNSNNMVNSTPFNFEGFDQVPFKEYRDPMDPSNVDMDMSFFNDAFPMSGFELGSPIIPASPAPQVVENASSNSHKQAPYNTIEDPDEADYTSEEDEQLIGAKSDKGLMSCNKIWDRISVHPKFVSGELDMDNLCSELRAKAKCSETGVVVGEKDVEEVLSKVGLKLREPSQPA